MIEYTPRWSLGDFSAPGSPVLSTALAREHVRLVGTADDTLLESLVLAATLYVQRITGRLLFSQTVTEYQNEFPYLQRLDLHVYPITSVVLSYYDSTDALVVMSAADYWLLAGHKPVQLQAKTAWPVVSQRQASVQVAITGGAAPPEDIIQALKLIVGQWYDAPEDVSTVIPAAARNLLAQHRVFR